MISAPAMIEPEGPVTVPDSVAHVICARAGEGITMQNNGEKNATRPSAYFSKLPPRQIIDILLWYVHVTSMLDHAHMQAHSPRVLLTFSSSS
jgi:hypothetical protein